MPPLIRPIVAPGLRSADRLADDPADPGRPRSRRLDVAFLDHGGSFDDASARRAAAATGFGVA
ncbi:MAG: hypothetical protein HYZ20_12410 [Burkholderiales bacterium]|nr:hypothetical protein [Burkholderiales bacterium]